MPRFKCINQDCDSFEKVITIANIKYFFDEKQKTLKPKDNDIMCVDCKKIMEEIKNKTNGELNFYFASFRAKSDQEKKTILKKRADDHTRTKMKDRIHNIKKKFGTI